MSCFWKNDQKEDGGLDETIAPDNRSVVWIDRNSKLAESILNDTDASKFMIEE